MAENPTLPGARGEAPGREFHAVADLFPPLSGAAFEQLVADIKKNGLREPILCDAEGRIIDGRNRYRACCAANVEPRFTEWLGEGSLTDLAVSLNLRRRHLDESQRAVVAARLAKWMENEAVKRKGTRRDLAANLQPGQRQRSASEAAAQVNISPRLVHYAIKVLQNGCSELLAAVESGVLAVSTAAALSGLPEEEQKNVLAGGAKEAARKVRELRAGRNQAERPSPGCFGVVRGDTLPLAPPENAGQDGVVFLWVDSGGVDEAMDALQARGFRVRPRPT